VKSILVITICAGVFLLNAPAETMSASKNSDKLGQSTIKGCLVSAGGKFVLQERRGRATPVSGSTELGSHVGHTVMAHGLLTNAVINKPANGNMGAASSRVLLVSKLDVISDTCGNEKKLAQTYNSNGKPSPYHK
jgi:hypothetical protein